MTTIAKILLRLSFPATLLYVGYTILCGFSASTGLSLPF